MNNVIEVPIVEELHKSFLDYSMSVITDRALPAAEDGLKPVIRRSLYAMFDKGWGVKSPFIKSALPVSECMGQYHPHGDSSIYQAIVAVSQPWTARYPLVDFHGNNGGRDGDPPAAYRYTECKLSKVSESTLKDIKKNVVPWTSNYLETKDEPVHLPGMFPNLLCNGGSGIAVGMACSFAPHNFYEVMSAIIHTLDNPDCSIRDLMEFVTGPDFPTGGLIINKDELYEAYSTGKGRARMRAEYKIETNGDKTSIVFTSIPFKVSKEQLTVAIDQLAEDKKIDNVVTVRDESSANEVRFVVEFGKGVNPSRAAEQLFKTTALECTYSINQVALVGQVPRLLNLKQIIEVYLTHQKQVLENKSKNEYEKIAAKVHLIEGSLIALEDIDNVINLIKGSENTQNAKVLLMGKYGLDEIQAKAILDMKLGRLSRLEKMELMNEKTELVKLQEYYNQILTNSLFAKEELKKILVEYSQEFKDERRSTITQINPVKEDKEALSIVAEECMIVSGNGMIKRVPINSYKPQNRNTKGVKISDTPDCTLSSNTTDFLLVFTNFGRMYKLSVDLIPAGTNVSKGQLLSSLIAFEKGETPCSMYAQKRDTEVENLVFVTKNGTVKKTSFGEYSNISKKAGIVAIKLREGDTVAAVHLMDEEPLLIVTKKGFGISIKSSDIPSSSRATIGVKGINLSNEDFVAVAMPITANSKLAIFGTSGHAIKIDAPIDTTSRGGKGIRYYKESDIANIIPVQDNDNIVIFGNKTNVTIKASSIPTSSRGCVGVKVIKDSTVVSVTSFKE